MESYSFYLDTKVTTWYRTPFEIEANSLEEAKELSIKFVERDGQSEISWEQVDDTTELMSVGDNGGLPTQELFYEPVGDMIWDNIKDK